MVAEVTPSEIVRLLADKHSKDVFVPECKDGPTIFGTHLRLDAWAMRKSWSNPDTFGYEIKVNRSDFLGDDKWPSYLPLCTRFSFVCPHGVIRVEELSQGCGLIYVSKTGTRLFTKVKAPRRDVEIPENIFRYILMCRATIGGEDNGGRQPGTDYWQRWLAEKREKQAIGYRVNGRVNRLYHEIKVKNIELQKRCDGYESIRKRIEELGFDPEFEIGSWRVKQKLDELTGKVSPALARRIRLVIREMEHFACDLDDLSTRGAT